MKQLLPKARIPEWDDAAVRELIQSRHGPFYVATPAATKLDGLATHAYRGGPADVARLGQAVARALGVLGAPIPGLPDDVAKLAAEIAAALKSADRPLVVAGTGLGSAETIRAAADVANALVAAGKAAGIFLTQAEPNSVGASMLGGGDLDGAFQAVREGRADTVVILENDLYRRAPADQVDAFLAAATHVVAIDHLVNTTTERAEISLPAATFAESDGTLVNNEGRAQRFLQVFVPTGGIQESWRWLHDVAVAAERLPAGSWQSLDAVIASMIGAHPALAGVADAAPAADFRISGQRIARQSRRFSGRTAMLANLTVHEPKPPADPDTPLSFSMEGFHGQPPSPLITEFWSPGWNSIQSLNKFQDEIAGPLRGGDPGRRLLEPPSEASEGAPRYFADATSPDVSTSGQLLAVPLYHIFGSEELSVHTPGIAELAPAPYLGLSSVDAERLGLAADARLSIKFGALLVDLAVRIIPSLPAGIVGVPVGLPGLTGLDLPTYLDFGGAASGRGA